MSEEKITVTRYTCDGCGNSTVVEPEDDPYDVYGYHGTVSFIGAHGGGGSVKWYADKERCIKKAVINALSNADG